MSETVRGVCEGGCRLHRAEAPRVFGFPKISVLVVARNSGAMIERAIESAASQGHVDVEIIVLDAESRDGTLEVLRRHDAKITYWRSAPDHGPVAASNEAISLATGDIICFLNADDWLEPGALQAVAETFRRHPTVDIVTGGARFVTVGDDGAISTLWQQPSRVSHLSWHVILAGSPVINARFFHRRVFERVGLFDDGIVNPNDRDFLARCLLTGIREHLLSELAYSYRVHEGSNSLSSSRENLIEFRHDHVRLAERFLADHVLPADVARRMRRWRSRELAHLVMLEGRHGRWRDALEAWREGNAKDRLFPMAFAAQAMALMGLWLRAAWRRRRGRQPNPGTP